jgi:hypothetical protein
MSSLIKCPRISWEVGWWWWGGGGPAVVREYSIEGVRFRDKPSLSQLMYRLYVS